MREAGRGAVEGQRERGEGERVQYEEVKEECHPDNKQ